MYSTKWPGQADEECFFCLRGGGSLLVDFLSLFLEGKTDNYNPDSESFNTGDIFLEIFIMMYF